MKAKRYVLLVMMAALTVAAAGQSLFVGSYNIRNKNNGDSINGNVWTKRCQVLCDQVNFESPDIFGSQEVLHGQLLDMLRQLDGYGYVGVGRDDGKEAGEYEPIFYKKDRIRLLRTGNFWLNETPDVPRLGWDAACIRVCTWGLFKDLRSRKKFYFFNLHMDHVGVVARREAAKLVVSRICEIAKGLPVVLTGDFNVDQTDEIYRTFTESGILKDSYEYARLRFAENGTFNSFDPLLVTESRIDHIFVSPQFAVDAYGVLTNSYWTADEHSVSEQKAPDAPQEINFRAHVRRNPSDHYPIFARIKYQK